jgi:uncharacterized membrane protein
MNRWHFVSALMFASELTIITGPPLMSSDITKAVGFWLAVLGVGSLCLGEARRHKDDF